MVPFCGATIDGGSGGAFVVVTKNLPVALQPPQRLSGSQARARQ
jgi:hypothetical protein